MKFLYKYRRLIGSVLAFTVSVMLFVTSIPASAASSDSLTRYGSLFICPALSNGHETFVRSSDTGIRYDETYGCQFTSNFFFTYKFDEPFTVYSNSDDNFCLTLQWNITSALKLHTATLKAYSFFIVFKNPDGRYYYAYINLNEIDRQYVSSGTFHEYAYYSSCGNDNFAQYCNLYKINSAQVVGIAFKSQIAVDGWSSVKVSACNTHYSVGQNVFKGLNSILSFVFRPLFSWLGTAYSSVINFLGDRLEAKFEILGSILNGIGKVIEPVLSAAFDGFILPVLNSILDSLNGVVTKAVEVFSPIFSGIINYFSPYFNQITNIITDNFINLVSNLTPLINQFVTAITPSFDSIVTNISKNISNIIKECFIPDDTSAEYIEFVSMKDDVSNKFPVFNQLNSFVSVLFDPTGYSPGSSVEYSNLICTFDGFSTSNESLVISRKYNFVSGKSYLLSCNVSSPVNLTLVFKLPNGSNYKQYTLFNGNNNINFILNKDCTFFQFVIHDNTGHISLTDICLYSVDNSAGQEFTVNVYGKNVSVLNFEWYMPYKHYGDLCVIAFCYLAFIWHTFKKLPTII